MCNKTSSWDICCTWGGKYLPLCLTFAWNFLGQNEGKQFLTGSSSRICCIATFKKKKYWFNGYHIYKHNTKVFAQSPSIYVNMFFSGNILILLWSSWKCFPPHTYMINCHWDSTIGTVGGNVCCLSKRKRKRKTVQDILLLNLAFSDL